MIKKEFICSLFIFSISFIFAQAPNFQSTQNLSPREVFVGDTAEISYSFYSPINFPLGDSSSMDIDFSKDILAVDTDRYTIKNATLSLIGDQYKLSILFVPWQPGVIDFPAFDLMTVFDKESTGLVIDLTPVLIASIIDKTGKNSLQPPSPPILIPGTTYAIYAVAIVSLLILILIIRIIFNINGLISFWQRVVLYFGYGRNARIALKVINLLRKKVDKFSNEEFSEKVQKTLRNYLGYRFGEEFYSITTDKITLFFNDLMQGTISFSMSLNIEDLSNIFKRLDYIRYAHDSIDSKRFPQNKYSTVLPTEERLLILTKINDIITHFENPEKEEDPTIKEVEND